ncbi:MAG: FixH family protein [Acidobacteriota bacterium]|nr:FixH family protein [Acidobacteriota bacterium]
MAVENNQDDASKLILHFQIDPLTLNLASGDWFLFQKFKKIMRGKIMSKCFLVFSLFAIALFAAACGSTSTGTAPGKTIKSGPAGNNLTATISNADGVLRKGEQEFTLTFTDASGKPVDVGAVAYTNHMAAMGSMAAMNNAATFTTTNTPGVYRGKVNIEMAGDWQAQITYEGVAGKGSFTLPVTAQ